MSSEPYVPDEDVIENAYVDAHLDGRRGGIPAQVSSAEFRRGIAKIKADALRAFAAKDIPAAVEARRTLLAEADRIEQEARDGL